MPDTTHSAQPLTATTFMAKQANHETTFHSGHTAQEVVDNWVDRTVEQAENNGYRVGSRAVTTKRAVSYLIEVGGPTLDVTFVFTFADEADDDPDNPDLDYAVIEYTEPGLRVQRVITGWAANRLYRALRADDTD